MALAETALPPSQGARALLIAAASIAILATVWIFQGFGYAPCELCLTQRYAFYAAAPLALLTAFLASRSAHGLARAGFALLALVFAANTALAAYHAGVEYHWWQGPTACTGGSTGSLDVNDLVNALNRSKSCAATKSSCALPDYPSPAGMSLPAPCWRFTRRSPRGVERFMSLGAF